MKKSLLACLSLLLAVAMTWAGTFSEQGDTVSMEAENYTSQTGYTEITASGASGKAMQVGDSGSLNFEINFSNSGLWYVWIRTQAHDAESNGLFLEIDGIRQKAPAGHPLAGISDIYLKKGSSWYWTPEWQGSGSGNHEGPITIDLASAGTHTLSIVKRKIERPWIDKIVLTRSNTAPTGTGPAETAGGGGGGTNAAPTVDAGPNRTITLPTDTTSLNGAVTDPEDTPSVWWTKVSGPGAVSFSDSTDEDTNITLGTAGTYVLKLSANDGNNPVVTDTVQVIVNPEPAQDQDSDGLPDSWEEQYFADTGACDPGADADGDGLTNLQEYNSRTNPTNPDTDGDGEPDGTDADPLGSSEDAGTKAGCVPSQSSSSLVLVLGLILGLWVKRG